MNGDYALWFLGASILTLAGTFLIKGPKEISGELANELRELRREFHHWRDLVTRHDEGMKSLTGSIQALSQRLDRLEPYARARGNGRRE